MLPWLFNVNKDGVGTEVNAWVLWKWLKLVSALGKRFDINWFYVFRRHSTIPADSELFIAKITVMYTGVNAVYFVKKILKVNVGMSKVIRCARDDVT